jgi:hypothetical protein
MVSGEHADDDEETDDPLVADVRNFYKVEKWTRDGLIACCMPAIILARRGTYSPTPSSTGHGSG